MGQQLHRTEELPLFFSLLAVLKYAHGWSVHLWTHLHIKPYGKAGSSSYHHYVSFFLVFQDTRWPWGKRPRMNLQVCLPGTGGDLLLSWSPIALPWKCLVQVFLCAHLTCITIDHPQIYSWPFVYLFAMTIQHKDMLPHLILLPIWCDSKLLDAVFKTLLLHFKAEFALEAAPLHAGVKHEPLALRAATPVSRLVQNSLCSMVRARINEITFFHHLKDKDPA